MPSRAHSSFTRRTAPGSNAPGLYESTDGGATFTAAPFWLEAADGVRPVADLPAPGALGTPEAATHIDATRDLSTETAGLRPGETEIVEDVYED
jgi:hypothetical protein